MTDKEKAEYIIRIIQDNHSPIIAQQWQKDFIVEALKLSNMEREGIKTYHLKHHLMTNEKLLELKQTLQELSECNGQASQSDICDYILAYIKVLITIKHCKNCTYAIGTQLTCVNKRSDENGDCVGDDMGCKGWAER